MVIASRGEIFPFTKVISVDFLLDDTVWKWKYILNLVLDYQNSSISLLFIQRTPCYLLWASEERHWLCNLKTV
jgi:hypothetical protein